MDSEPCDSLADLLVLLKASSSGPTSATLSEFSGIGGHADRSSDRVYPLADEHFLLGDEQSEDPAVEERSGIEQHWPRYR